VVLRYHLGWEDAAGAPAEHPGKRLRPSLCLLACEAAGGEPRRALPIAAAIELVHNFSLVHDDIQDRDATRHGRDTVWSLWGEAQAINAGDALLAIAHLSLAESAEAGLSAEAALQAVTLLSRRTLEMVGGQVMDIEFEERLDVTLEEYLAMISRKTGALFDAALALGALAGGAPTATIEAMGRCGRSLGVAFQVRDDMLGVWGAEQLTGKPAAADIRRRKKSLPVLYAFQQAAPGDRERLRALYSRGEISEGDVGWVSAVMDSLHAQSYCSGVAAQHRDAALRELEAAGLDGERAAELRQTADFLLDRDY
jgi:geranylgeranyl diphosphate synthase type I